MTMLVLVVVLILDSRLSSDDLASDHA